VPITMVIAKPYISIKEDELPVFGFGIIERVTYQGLALGIRDALACDFALRLDFPGFATILLPF